MGKNMLGSKQSLHISGIVLAAGASLRMGRTKQLLPVARSSMLGQVVENARRSDLNDIVVVLGHRSDQIRAQVDLSGTTVILNPDYALGQSTSVKAGIARVADDADAAMILLADQPLVGEEVINCLIQSFRHSRAPIVVPVFQGRRGNPAIIARPLFSELMTCLTGDTGARMLFSNHLNEIQRVAVSTDAVLFDVDRMDDYHRLLARSEAGDGAIALTDQTAARTE